MKYILLAFLLFSFATQAQNVIQTYDEARDTYFWKVLYKDGGKTLYCDLKFDGIPDSDDEKPDHQKKKLNVEHVMPASWMAAHFGCKNRYSCPVDAYQHAAADLHNLWPAIGIINQDRNNLPFGNITGESDANRIRKNICKDAERIGTKNSGIFEPRDSVKGDVARSLLYMELAYGIPLGRDRKMLIKWAKKDPVDANEIERNKRIFKIQRRKNPFIKGDDGKTLDPAEY